MRAALYTRGADEDDVHDQLQRLQEHAEKSGWVVAAHFTDVCAGARAGRRELDRLLQGVEEHDFDLVAFSDLSRLGGSLDDVVAALHLIRRQAVRWVALNVSPAYDSASDEVADSLIHALVRCSRDLARDRIADGVARARREGTAHGRPRRNVDLEQVRRLLAEGRSINEVSKIMGVTRSTLQRRIKEAEATARIK